MKRSEYLRQLLEAMEAGRITPEAYDHGVMNADVFSEEDDAE